MTKCELDGVPEFIVEMNNNQRHKNRVCEFRVFQESMTHKHIQIVIWFDDFIRNCMLKDAAAIRAQLNVVQTKTAIELWAEFKVEKLRC